MTNKQKKPHIPNDQLREYIASQKKDYYTISDITPLVAQNADVAHYKVEPIGAAFLRVLQILLMDGKTVVLHGVGTFTVNPVKSYWGKDVKGEKMAVKGHKRISFKAAKTVKYGLNPKPPAKKKNG